MFWGQSWGGAAFQTHLLAGCTGAELRMDLGKATLHNLKKPHQSLWEGAELLWEEKEIAQVGNSGKALIEVRTVAFDPVFISLSVFRFV